MNPLSVRQLFESHLPAQAERRPELVAAARSSFRFVVEGEGTWLIDLQDDPVRVTPGETGGRCTLAASADTVSGIALGRINPRAAWQDGRLRTEGELQPAMLAVLLQLLQIPADEPHGALRSAPPPLTESFGGGLTVSTLRERPDLWGIANAIVATAWPEFMLNNPVANRYWKEMYAAFPDLQYVMRDAASGEVVAVGASAALAWNPDVDGWPEEGWDWALAQAVEDHRAGRKPNAQCGLIIAIANNHQGKGLSTKMVRAMKALGQRQGLDTLAIPVRPSVKSRYPLIPIERYVHWRRGDGQPFDAWLRSHTSLGAEIIGPCVRSTLIEGTVEEWEQWAKMSFPDSGSYVVPGALVPVEIDRAANRGVYLEPNVWVRHPMTR